MIQTEWKRTYFCNLRNRSNYHYKEVRQLLKQTINATSLFQYFVLFILWVKPIFQSIKIHDTLLFSISSGWNRYPVTFACRARRRNGSGGQGLWRCWLHRHRDCISHWSSHERIKEANSYNVSFKMTDCLHLPCSGVATSKAKPRATSPSKRWHDIVVDVADMMFATSNDVQVVSVGASVWITTPRTWLGVQLRKICEAIVWPNNVTLIRLCQQKLLIRQVWRCCEATW